MYLIRSFPGPLGLPPSFMQVLGAFFCGNDLLVQLCADVLYTINGLDTINFNRVTTLMICQKLINIQTKLFVHTHRP